MPAEEYASIRAVKEQREVHNVETGIVKENGNIIWTNVSAVPVAFSDWRVVIVTSDITERKQMEQMLIQSEKLASIGTIAAGIAHEINNPLGYIYSNLKTLQNYQEKLQNFCDNISSCLEEYSSSDNYDKKDILNKFKLCKSESAIEYIIDEIKSAVDESVEGAEKVKKIVQELRDFSRQEKPEIKPANINEIIEATVNILWNELKYKVEVIKEYDDIPDLECDRQKLEQVFMNIIINAIQAIEMHGKITIKTFTANNNIVAQISDTGKGIERKNTKRIFDAFFTTKEPGKGTGLGLSIASKIIHQHNGIIEAESEVGKGSTFTIKLPIRRRNV
jgi:signal transduction histidine kinase